MAFELQREHPTAAVVLVTGDANMQTKAELARLPFVEPPTA
jgi:predicted ribonuclease YlaK